jgi:hypothetical protein
VFFNFRRVGAPTGHCGKRGSRREREQELDLDLELELDEKSRRHLRVLTRKSFSVTEAGETKGGTVGWSAKWIMY